jgi:cell division protein FtsB
MLIIKGGSMRYLLTFFLFFTVLLFFNCQPGQQITQQIDKLNTEIKELKEKVNLLSATLDSLKGAYEEHYQQFHAKKPAPPVAPKIKPPTPKVKPPTRK